MKIKEITEAQMAGQYKVVKTGPEGTTLQSPDMHTMLTLDPEAAKGIVANPQNPNEFSLSQDVAQGMTNQQAPGEQQSGVKAGATVEIPANEGHGDNFEYEFETEIEGENGDTMQVTIGYNVYGEERPATWGYHGGEPAEHPEIDDVKVTNMETGEDVTGQVGDIDELIWNDFRQQQQSAADDVDPPEDYDFDENIGGDPTDDFIDDVRDKEFEKANKPGWDDLSHIKKLSGL